MSKKKQVTLAEDPGYKTTTRWYYDSANILRASVCVLINDKYYQKVGSGFRPLNLAWGGVTYAGRAEAIYERQGLSKADVWYVVSTGGFRAYGSYAEPEIVPAQLRKLKDKRTILTYLREGQDPSDAVVIYLNRKVGQDVDMTNVFATREDAVAYVKAVLKESADELAKTAKQYRDRARRFK